MKTARSNPWKAGPVALCTRSFRPDCSGVWLPSLADAAAAKSTKSTEAAATRTEHDLLGEKQVPADAYYGVQTLRGLENFQLSGVPINHYPGFVEAWAIVKLAAARANTDVGAMKQETPGRDREGLPGGARRASTTTNSWSIGTRAAPAPRRT